MNETCNEDWLKKRLNLNYLTYTNKTTYCGELDLPEILCDNSDYPDYIALYDQPGDYHRTSKTCVSFYNYDDVMDGGYGLRRAIENNDRRSLDKFKKRFEGVKYFMMPDYTIMGDLPAYRNHYMIGAAREVSIWLTMECNAIVIPNLAAGNVKDFNYIFKGLERVRVAGISTKGKLQNKSDRILLRETICEAVAQIPNLKAFVVYDDTASNLAVDRLFDEARSKGIEIIIPDNILKIRNRILYVMRESV